MPGASTGFLLRDGDVAGPGQLAQLLDERGVHDAAGGGAATTAPGASSAMLQFDSGLAASQADGDVKAASLARITVGDTK